MSFFRFVQSSNSAIVQTFGRYTKTVGPGLRFFVPLIRKMTPISHRLQQNTFKFDVKTKDNVFARPGLRFFVPLIKKMTPISYRLQQNTFQFDVKTKDNVPAHLGLTVQYIVDPKNAEKASFSLENPIALMDAYIKNVLRSKVPTMTLDNLYKSQNDICDSVGQTIGPKMSEHGYTIVSTLVTSIGWTQGCQ